MAQFTVTKATIADLQSANKLLRFAKNSKDLVLRFPHFEGKGLHDMCIAALSDAVWVTRADGTSQGGYFLLMAPKELLAGELTEYTILDWKSFKLSRVSRSSLNAETQAAVSANEAMEYCKVFVGLITTGETNLLSPTLRRTVPSALVVDAKSLYEIGRAHV